MSLAKGFGSKLFDAVFEGDVRELFRSSYADSRNNGRGLRVVVADRRAGAPRGAVGIPLRPPELPVDLDLDAGRPLPRPAEARRPLGIELPLRILGMISAPSDAEPIDVQQVRQKLETALVSLKDAGAIEIDWLEEANRAPATAPESRLPRLPLIGHGGYDDAADDGVLLFEDEQGRGRQVSGIQLGTMLADEVSLRLAILNACEGGRSSLRIRSPGLPRA